MQMQAINIVITRRKIKKYFIEMEVIKKIYEASIHKLTLYFLGLLKKILKNRFSL